MEIEVIFLPSASTSKQVPLATYRQKPMFDTMNPAHLPTSNNAFPDQALLSGTALRASLGFATGEAFRAAIRNGRIAVPLIKIAGRRGWFARAVDVAQWRKNLSDNFDAAKKGDMP